MTGLPFWLGVPSTNILSLQHMNILETSIIRDSKHYIDHEGSHIRSLSGMSSLLANASAIEYEIPHLKFGGPSNFSTGDVLCRKPAFDSSII
jgi:hypothetical protein